MTEIYSHDASQLGTPYRYQHQFDTDSRNYTYALLSELIVVSHLPHQFCLEKERILGRRIIYSFRFTVILRVTVNGECTT